MTQPANRPLLTTRSNGGSRSAPTWQSRLTGAPVQGRDGEKLGKVDTVYFDNDTDAPAWAAVTTDRFGGYVLLVPLAQADWDGATLSVPFDMQALKAAPHHDPDAAISPDDEDELYRHYGLSTTACRTTACLTTACPTAGLLPTGAATAPARRASRLRWTTATGRARATSSGTVTATSSAATARPARRQPAYRARWSR